MRRALTTFVVGGGGGIIADLIATSLPAWPGTICVYLWGAFIGMIVVRLLED